MSTVVRTVEEVPLDSIAPTTRATCAGEVGDVRIRAERPPNPCSDWPSVTSSSPAWTTAIRDLGQLLEATVPEEVGDFDPLPRALLEAIQDQTTVHDVVGVLFALRLVDYEARGRSEDQWQTDEGLCRYVSLLMERGYPSASGWGPTSSGQ